jgi:heme-degrading monooxygenase HmoA
MATITIVSHEVADFATWKKNFDAHESVRAQHGFRVQGVYRATENPNHVTVISEAPSVEAVIAFSQDPSLREAMEKGGVISKPEFRILETV